MLGIGGTDYYLHGNLEYTKQLIAYIFPGEEKLVSYDSLEEIPPYDGNPYVVLHDNIPSFTEEELSREPYEFYSELDSLGRCGVTEAMVSKELMPTEPRGEIGMIRPSGWHTAKYDIIDDKFLFNRCHLIAFELTGENDNERNLITGTRYMNFNGMLPWENKVAQYVRWNRDQVLYRVTPIFAGNELVARGVQIEAQSVKTKEIQFNIFVYNVQPDIVIDYRTGSSWIKG
ncbi:MAG: DNA/RNA non-specific endonuclease [Clostridiales bacterium]|nr:DNA/RNA non-specific endonuclease [Candidatus Blautia equi]